MVESEKKRRGDALIYKYTRRLINGVSLLSQMIKTIRTTQ